MSRIVGSDKTFLGSRFGWFGSGVHLRRGQGCNTSFLSLHCSNARKERTISGVGSIVGRPNKKQKSMPSPPEQAVTLRAMISCADENAHISVAGDETMAFHPPCAAASNEGEDHSWWWKHCWKPQQQEKKGAKSTRAGSDSQSHDLLCR